MSRRSRRPFIVGGGASLGAHQVGALRLLEREGIRPDGSVASSTSWGLETSVRRRLGRRAAEGAGRRSATVREVVPAYRLRGRLRVFALLAVLSLACTTAPEAPVREPLGLPEPLAGPPARVLLVSIAGLTPDRYEPAGSGPPPMPTLARLARAGVAASDVTPVAPASVYPAHATLVTGERPARHGVPADRLLGEGGVRTAPYSHASFLRVPTLWQRARAARLPVASFDWPSTVGAAIDALIPDVVPVRRGETWLELLTDTSTPWLVERVRAAGTGERTGPERDALLTSLACDVLGDGRPPSLVLLRYSQTEAALYAAGPDAPATSEAFLAVDRELERLLGCLRERGGLADTALLVVGDRGFLPVHTQVNPNRSLAESGLLRAPARGPGSWQAISRSNGGSAFVYARDEEAAVVARNLLEELADRTRAFRVVPAREMLDSGADPEAWFALEAEPGTIFGDGAGRAAVEPAAVRGAAGYLPGTAGSHPGFVAWGRGLRRGVRIPRMRQCDVAPTVAALLGLELAAKDGRTMVGALALPGTSVGAPGP